MSFDQLSDAERVKVAAEVDYFLSLMLRRYGLGEADIPEILASLRWLKEHREFMSRVQTGGTVSLLALLVSAIGASIWQGVKVLINGGGPR